MTHPKHLRRLVDFCCDRHGCGHHIDGHGYGGACNVPDCKCTGWRDHVGCDHREETDLAGRLAVAERALEIVKPERDRLIAALQAAAEDLADMRGRIGALQDRVTSGLMVRCWINEDGKRFAFADDIYALLDPDNAGKAEPREETAR